TYALTNIFTPILLDIGEQGSLKNVIWQKSGLREAVYIYQGHLTNKHMGERFSIPSKDLDLLIVSHH
ncbi:MAG TPA: alanine dehydrogenase, partial [Mucilaginibacter sp.]